MNRGGEEVKAATDVGGGDVAFRKEGGADEVGEECGVALGGGLGEPVLEFGIIGGEEAGDFFDGTEDEDRLSNNFANSRVHDFL